MLGIYIVGLIVGGALVLLSVLGAGHGHGDFATDHDISHDFGDHDLSVDHDLDHEGVGTAMHASDTWIPFLSLRFWTYFSAVFGACGLLLTKLSDLGQAEIAIYSGAGGILTGLIVAYSVRLLKKSEAGGSTTEKDILGTTALVTVALKSGLPGKIRCTVKGDILDLLALPEGASDIPVGAEVVVVGMEGNNAKVMPLTEIME